ncbi:stage V sporulation protein K [Anaeromicrobium sediminis]|uniref:Stage V sporulation protein K n=1 Tax=Anaeromicrobium sediminis TaxID=1478221 RepID=A0A267MNI5_9FIRM|nr:stage V sporulation protein K [Anaeromicrobium sediminis]
MYLIRKEIIINKYRQGQISTEDFFIKLIEEEKKEKRESVEKKALEKLNKLIGLKRVKKVVEEIIAVTLVQKIRKEKLLKSEPVVMHMIFKGNPGTGKTTVARILGEVFYEMNVLSQGHLVEAERADLVGEYIGHTAIKMRNHVKKAQGGILFIDEAYSLCRGGKKDFGKEAIDALVKGMEDNREDFILILAGYKEEMDAFLRSNPGLKSRFPIQIEFEDYNLDELISIGELMLKDREYKLSLGAKKKMKDVIEKNYKRDRYIGNARMVRNIIEASIRNQAVRLKKTNKYGVEDLIYIRKEDINKGEING